MKITTNILCLTLGIIGTAISAEPAIKKDKLQVFILLGQSNMVGMADISTFEYLLQEPFMPSLNEVLPAIKQGTYYANVFSKYGYELENEMYSDPQYFLLDGGDMKTKFRQKVIATIPHEQRVSEEDIYRDMIDRTKARIPLRKKLIERYLKGTTQSNFADLSKLKVEAKDTPEAQADRRNERLAYAKLIEKKIGLPIAKRTWISSYGALSAEDSLNNDDITRYANGPLSIGWGGKYSTIGPEYGFGLAMEEKLDAPILIIKCAWGNTQMCAAWRSPSAPRRVESPEEKTVREARNAALKAKAEKDGTEFKPQKAPDYSSDGWCWKVMKFPDHIAKVLADPGKYHPDYDPAKGYEVAGMVWFQGHSDAGYKNGTEYKSNLTHFIKDMRKVTKTPELPVVIGTVSTDVYKPRIDASPVVQSQLAVAELPEFKGNVTTVNTTPFYPTELDVLFYMNKKEGASKKWDSYKGISNKSYHYMGSAECFVGMSDAFADAMVQLMQKKN